MTNITYHVLFKEIIKLLKAQGAEASVFYMGGDEPCTIGDAIAKLQAADKRLTYSGKPGAQRKPGKKTREANGLREKIVLALCAHGGHMTTKEIRDTVPELNGSEPQRVTALLRPLINDGKVVKVPDSRPVAYRAATDEELIATDEEPATAPSDNDNQ